MLEDSEDYLDRLSDIVSEIVGHNNFTLKLDMHANEIEGWDSLAHIQIIHECEISLGIRFSLEEISKLNTVGDLVFLMQNKK